MIKSIVIDQHGNLRFPQLPPAQESELFTLLLPASPFVVTDFPKVMANDESVTPSAKDSVSNHYQLADGPYTIQWAADVTATLIVQQVGEDRRIHVRGVDGMDITLGSGTAALPTPADIP